MPPAPPHKPPRVRPRSSNYLAPSSSSSLTIGRSRRRRGRRSHGSSGGLLLYPRSGCPASPAAEVLRSMQSRSIWRFTLAAPSHPAAQSTSGRAARPIAQRGFANAMGLPRLVVRRRRRDELSLKVSFTRLPGQKKSIYSYQLRRRRRATARSVMCVQRAVEISA